MIEEVVHRGNFGNCVLGSGTIALHLGREQGGREDPLMLCDCVKKGEGLLL